ncbi:hemagglutinin repeat-containing protein [Ensifer sp. M14]
MDLSWKWGRTKSSSRSETKTAVGYSVSGGTGVTTRSDGDTLVSASNLGAGTKDWKADLDLKSVGDIVISSGKDSHEMREQTSSKGFLKKSSSSVERADEPTVASDSERQRQRKSRRHPPFRRHWYRRRHRAQWRGNRPDRQRRGIDGQVEVRRHGEFTRSGGTVRQSDQDGDV